MEICIMKVIEHKTATITLDDSGIVWFKFKTDTVVDLKAVHDYVQIIEELCEGIPKPFILDARDIFANFAPDARKYMGTNSRALKFRLADAVLLNSLPIKLIAKIYMTVDTPRHPVKAFTKEEDAFKWLAQFKA